MTNALTDIETLEVTLCRRGKNKKRFALSKRAGPEAKPMPINGNMRDVLEAVMDCPLENEDDHIDKLKKAKVDGKAIDALVAATRTLNAYRDILPADVMKQAAEMGGFPFKPEEDEDKEKAKKEEEEAAAEKAKKEEEEKAKMEDEKAKAEKEEEGAKVDPEVQAKLDKLWKAKEESDKRAEKLETLLKSERDTRLKKEFIHKSEQSYSAIPGKSAEELADVLVSLHKSAPEAAIVVEGILEACNEIISKGALFDELGTAARGGVSSGMSKIEKMAGDMVKKSSDMTKAEAIDVVLTQNPELYEEYLNENPAQSGRRG